MIDEYQTVGFTAWQVKRKNGQTDQPFDVNVNLSPGSAAWFEFYDWYARLPKVSPLPLYEFCWKAWVAAGPITDIRYNDFKAFNRWWATAGH